MRWLLMRLRGVAAAVALGFVVLAGIHVSRSAWMLWVEQLAGTVAPLMLGACLGYISLRVVIAVCQIVSRRRALPRARVVRR